MYKVITMKYEDFVSVHPNWKKDLLDCNYIVTSCHDDGTKSGKVMAIRNDKNQMKVSYFKTKQEAINWIRGYYYEGGKIILC